MNHFWLVLENKFVECVAEPLSDIESFNEAKFERIHRYIKDHLSRDSCPLCSGNI